MVHIINVLKFYVKNVMSLPRVILEPFLLFLATPTSSQQVASKLEFGLVGRAGMNFNIGSLNQKFSC